MNNFVHSKMYVKFKYHKSVRSNLGILNIEKSLKTKEMPHFYSQLPPSTRALNKTTSQKCVASKSVLN